jgi:putative hydrolase of the HAD superfamily
MRLEAVGFDLDGTLYPNYRFHLRLLPFLMRRTPLLLSMGHARAELRRPGRPAAGTDFYRQQAELAAGRLGLEPERLQTLFDEEIYRAWPPIFSHVRPRRGVREAILRLRAAGLKTGLLSDFPLADKLERLGLEGLWDAKICSEEVGRLKPGAEPFLALARALGTEPAAMAYVGNSERYDVAGAADLGMRAVLVARRRPRKSRAQAVFTRFDSLADWLLSQS